MANVDTLHVAAWTAKDLPRNLVLTRYVMPVSAHDVLVQWCRQATGRSTDMPTSIALAGLSEVLSFFVPETAYMAHERDAGDTGQRRQCLYFLGDVSGDGELRKRLRTAMLMWLTILYPDKDAEMRMFVAETAIDDQNWRVRQIGTGLKRHHGVCAVPEEGALFDALTVHAVAKLAGKTLQFESGESRILVPETPQSQPFGGVELVAFPPKKERDGPGLYTEVVRITAANFPEQRGQGLQILARPSIRNWGPLDRDSHDLSGSPARSLDVFMPPGDGSGDYAAYRHMSFRFKAMVENWKEVHERNVIKRIHLRWESQRSHRIFELIARLAGNNRIAAYQTEPIIGDDGLWVLPRLAPGSGDRYLAGGSGVGWQDRSDMAVSLDGPLRKAGFERSTSMTRITRRMPIKGPFNSSRSNLEATAPMRRAGVIKTLRAIGNAACELDLLVLQKLDGTAAVIRDEVKSYFGQPDGESNERLEWRDGLKICITAAPAGPLAEALPFYELPEDERADLTKAQQNELARARQMQENQRAAVEMARYIDCVRAGRKAIGCAILEMAASLKTRPQRDPFAMARRLLAERNILPQVVLVDDGGPEEKYRAAFRDLIRMLGVLPVFEERLPYAPAALTVIQRNDEMVGGGNIRTQAFPLAVRTREGILECAIPDESGEPSWMPYAAAALRIYSGSYGRFARNRTEENQRKFDVFFGAVLEQIDRTAASLVVTDMETVGERLPALRNGSLVFDKLPIGTRSFMPDGLPNTRIVRTYSDNAKLPCYFQAEAEWPGGLFGWGEAQRTAYGVKKKPVSARRIGYFSLMSRHPDTEDHRNWDYKPRRIAALDEICAVFKQPGDDPNELMMMTHRLRSVHAQYDDDTSLPFPLHEARLLGGAVTS